MRCALLIALLLPCAAFGQGPSTPAHANFTGRWRMDKQRSDFARAPMPDMIVRVIDQRDSTMNVHTIQTVGKKTSAADISYFTDGAEASNVINGHSAVSKAFWDGSALMIRTEVKLSDTDTELIEDRWELSPDGNTLTTTSHLITPKGETDMKMVCVKEGTS